MQSVVDRTGVPADTIRSWERRHGFPAPARDAQNQRVYSEDDIQAISRLKAQTARGITVKEALRLLPSESGSHSRPTVPADRSDPGIAHVESEPRAGLPLVDRLLETLMAFDGAAAKSLLHTEMATQSPEAVAFESILPAVERLVAETSVGASFAREFLHRIMISLFHASDPDTGRFLVVVVRVAQTGRSRDSLLALAHALAASRLGFSALYLDDDGDVAIIRQIISSLGPHAVILVADTAEDIGTATQWWSLLDELPSLRDWTGKRLVASSRRPPLPRSSGSGSSLWLRPDASAARVLLESRTAGHRDGMQMVGNS